MPRINPQDYLQDLIKPDYVIHDDEAFYLKFSVTALDQPLIDAIQERLGPYDLQSTVFSLSTESGGKNAVVLKILPKGEMDIETDVPYVPTRTRKTWRSHPMFHAALFILTGLVVFLTGATTIINRSLSEPWNWSTGFQFSFALLGILTAHEFGHYFAARYHKLKVSLPYYLPGILIPPIASVGFPGTTIMPGTFGAFIRIQSPIRNKRELMDVGAAGPIAGFIVCLAVLIIGFATIPEKSYAYQFYDVEALYDGNPVLMFGNSILFQALGFIFAGENMPAMYDIVHYPLIFAGWFGLLVTALNLLPIGQLDGGHIMYALMGDRHRYLSYAAFAGVLGLGLWYGATNWFLWALLVILLIRFRHPPVLDSHQPLDRPRKLIAIVSIVIFILSFMPTPVYERILTR